MPKPVRRPSGSRPAAHRRPAAAPAAVPEEVTVEGVGIRGDGLARGIAGRLYIEGVLPAERVRVQPLETRGDGRVAALLEVLEPSAGRQQPPCPVVAQCGGCQLQHAGPSIYAGIKQGWVAQALAAQQVPAAELRPLLVLPPATRRRATLHLKLEGRRTVLGFNARRSHATVDAAPCRVLSPALVMLLAPLREAFAALPATGAALSLHLALLDGGVQAVLTGALPPGPLVLQDLSDLAAKLDLAELWHRPAEREAPIPLALRRRLHLRIGGVAVPLPPAAFLQASAEGEAALQALVREAVGAPQPEAAPRRLIDLFAGLGTLGLSVATPQDRLELVDSDGPAVAALTGAARSHPNLTVTPRDLHREPLPPARLSGADAIVFDPPRAGTGAQIAALAEADVPVLAAVSCNPISFAADARQLLARGWQLDWVQPVDQFAWAAHVELAARFSRR